MRFLKHIIFLNLFLHTCAFCTASDTVKDNEPFDLLLDNNNISPAKIQEPHKWKKHNFSYSNTDIIASYKFKALSQELMLGIGGSHTRFGFGDKPKIRQHNFNNLLLKFGTSGIKRDLWEVDGGISAQVNPDNLSVFRTLFLLGELHGRYEWNEKSIFHLGLIGCTGMHFTRLLPIIGIDMKYGDRWKLNLVFPTDISVLYSLNDNWSIGTALRYFLSRQRLKEDEHHHLKRGFLLYHNWGGDVGLNYKINDRLSAGVHVGESFGGRVRMSNRHNSHRKHIQMNSSLYWGLGAVLKF